jgi:hypothetical protein
MLFEMLTGDFLFEPRRGPTFSKNDDHLAQVFKKIILLNCCNRILNIRFLN